MKFPAAPRIGSAHVLASMAICLSVGGGGYALAAVSAGAPGAPGSTLGYATSGERDFTQPAGRDNLVSQLVVPATGFYAVTAKVVIRKGGGDGFADGVVTCHIGDVPGAADDLSSVTVKRGATVTISMLSMGGSGGTGGTGQQAFDLVCASPRSKYVVTSADISAVTLDGVTR